MTDRQAYRARLAAELTETLAMCRMTRLGDACDQEARARVTVAHATSAYHAARRELEAAQKAREAAALAFDVGAKGTVK
jgi:hypothetical protein